MSNNKSDAHNLRKQVYEMNNNKVDATFHHPEPSKRELKRAARREQFRRAPLAARIGAVVVLVLLLVVLPASCAIKGAAYDACIRKIAQEDGYEQAKLAQAQGECW